MTGSRMNFVGIMLAGIVVLSLAAMPADAQSRAGAGWRGMGGDGPGMLLPIVLKGANLTPDQEAKVHKIIADHRSTFRTLFSQMRKAHEELADKLYGSGEVQAAALTPQVEQVSQLRTQLLQEGLKIALEVRQVLTPEQRAKVAHVKDRMRALRAEMRSLITELD
jgi:Spy/CpxP family protein refolding chaperone